MKGQEVEPEVIYCGPREVVIAEVGGSAHIYPGKFLVQPDGNAAFDAEGADTVEDMEEFVSEYRRLYPNILVVRL